MGAAMLPIKIRTDATQFTDMGTTVFENDDEI